jgi:hypothetical protein
VRKLSPFVNAFITDTFDPGSPTRVGLLSVLVGSVAGVLHDER